MTNSYNQILLASLLGLSFAALCGTNLLAKLRKKFLTTQAKHVEAPIELQSM
jgi:hypothetical protein